MKALQDASSGNESDDSASNGSGGSSSDSDFNPVMKAEEASEEPKGKKAGVKAKAQTKAAAKKKARTEKSNEVEKPSAKDKDAQKEAARFTSAISTQQKTLDLLKELNFALI